MLFSVLLVMDMNIYISQSERDLLTSKTNTLLALGVIRVDRALLEKEMTFLNFLHPPDRSPNSSDMVWEPFFWESMTCFWRETRDLFCSCHSTLSKTCVMKIRFGQISALELKQDARSTPDRHHTDCIHPTLLSPLKLIASLKGLHTFSNWSISLEI